MAHGVVDDIVIGFGIVGQAKDSFEAVAYWSGKPEIWKCGIDSCDESLTISRGVQGGRIGVGLCVHNDRLDADFNRGKGFGRADCVVVLWRTEAGCIITTQYEASEIFSGICDLLAQARQRHLLSQKLKSYRSVRQSVVLIRYPAHYTAAKDTAVFEVS